MDAHTVWRVSRALHSHVGCAAVCCAPCLACARACVSVRVCAARMNFLGLFTFTAPYLPWVLLAFSFVLGNNGVVDVVGIAVGHLYYFLEDVYPLMLPSRKRLLATPRLVQLLFAAQDEHNAEPLPPIIHEEQLQQHIQLHEPEQPQPEQQQQQQQHERREEAEAAGAEAAQSDAQAARGAEQSGGQQSEAGDMRAQQRGVAQDADDDGASDQATGLHRRTQAASSRLGSAEAAAT